MSDLAERIDTLRDWAECRIAAGLERTAEDVLALIAAYEGQKAKLDAFAEARKDMLAFSADVDRQYAEGAAREIALEADPAELTEKED